MKRILLAMLCLWPLLLVACNTTNAVEEPTSLAEVHMYQANINVGHYDVRIAPSGELGVQLQRGTGEIQRGTAQLTPDQITTLFNAFKGWRKLGPAYPGDWSNLIQITYDGYQVEAHDPTQAPKTFTTVQGLLINYASQALAAATKPAAAQPASQPAPAATP
jgi:hypothetical protein